jgi:dipeptidyl aminopeptidase/acylaminoacyl peptidase
MRKLLSGYLFIIFLFLAVNTAAQDKKVLSIEDYGQWSHIVGTELSDNGNWMAYGLNPNEGNDTLYVKSLSDSEVYELPLGDDAEFSSDSRWVAYTTMPDEETREKMEENDQEVYEKAWLLNLDTGEKRSVEQAKGMTFSENGKYWLVHREKENANPNDPRGSDLILHDLQDGATMNIGNVSEYAFNKRSDMLAYLVDAKDKTGNGVYLRNLDTGTLTTLDSDTVHYTGLTWDDEDARREQWNSQGRALAVLKGAKIDSLVYRPYKLLVMKNVDGQPSKSVLNPETNDNFPKEMVISDNRSLSWSENGERLFLGIREQEPDLEMDQDTIPNVDVFHWKDERIQTVQKQDAEEDRRFTWVASFDPDNSEFARLTDENLRELNFSRHNEYMIGRDEKPYISDINWGVSPANLYRVDISSGERTKFADKVKRPMGYSPDGRYYLYQQVSEQDTVLMVYDVEKNEKTNISSSAPVNFLDKEHPYPHENPTYGLAGWTADKEHVIVNHKYDLWMLALDGSEAVNITQGLGKKEQIEFRYENLDENEEWIDTSEDMLLEAFGEWTKKDGFYRLKMGQEPQPLLYADASFGDVEKARNSDRVIMTRETFENFPDYYKTTTNFEELEKVTNANPQQSEYAWGRRVLVEYENDRGIKLQGTLTLPANYEPGKEYPMIVYFYEQMSDRHHQYSMPVYDDRPHMSTYASNGYLVLMPDNVYQTGRPGTSALDCITAATQKVIDEGYADPDRIGLQGHSWGGYQSSFILTQTDMFATVVTGAPPTNLTSFYNNIYGSTGTNHHGIMEIGQVRMGRGVTPWTHRDTYERENPMYHVPDIETPFMILHGTDDGAVDWMQGLKFYNAARRLDKEVVLLSYPGEGHHLSREANQKDFQVRMMQWFDHYVKGEPAAEWIQEGIPYLKKPYNKAGE